MEMHSKLIMETTFEALHIRNGKVIGRRIQRRPWTRKMVEQFLAWLREGRLPSDAGLVTTAGMTYLCTSFNNSTSNPMSAFEYHDAGTGTNSATIGQSALTSPWGGARATGAPTASTNTFTTVATITFASGGPYAITEWGLFSASSSGTMWDRREFSAINVNNGDSIQFTYTCTCTAGGS